MTPPVIVDTDLVIDFLRGRGDGAAVLPVWLAERRVRLTTITLFELRSGLDWERRGVDLAPLFRDGPITLDAGAATEAGAIERTLRSAGTPIGIADTLQAGICIHRGLALATRNRRHFERIDGLTLVDLTMSP